jgi:hypothetical protein
MQETAQEAAMGGMCLCPMSWMPMITITCGKLVGERSSFQGVWWQSLMWRPGAIDRFAPPWQRRGAFMPPMPSMARTNIFVPMNANIRWNVRHEMATIVKGPQSLLSVSVIRDQAKNSWR